MTVSRFGSTIGFGLTGFFFSNFFSPFWNTFGGSGSEGAESCFAKRREDLGTFVFADEFSVVVLFTGCRFLESDCPATEDSEIILATSLIFLAWFEAKESPWTPSVLAAPSLPFDEPGKVVVPWAQKDKVGVGLMVIGWYQNGRSQEPLVFS